MSKKILVIGEKAIDRTIYCGCDRLSPEKPAPVLLPLRIIETLGMAGNVYSNLKSLSPNWEIFWIHQKTPIIKTRYIDDISNHYFFRVDENDVISTEECLNEGDLDKFLEGFKLTLQDLSAVVISSYGKGFLTKDFIYFISHVCRLRNIPVWMDCKFILGEWSKNVTFCKINRKEYEANTRFHISPEIFVENLIVTDGKNGCTWMNRNITIPTEVVEVVDVQGCGDVFLSCFVVSYLQDQNIEKSLTLANKAATLAATKRGTVSIKRESVFQQ